MELINATVYEPHDSIFKSSRKDHAECKTIYCSRKDSCDLYKKNQCLFQGMFSGGCPYGRKSTETGPTPKAMKYSSWIRERKDKFKDVLRKIGSPDKKICVIGDYIWLPYAHIDMNKDVPFVRHSAVFVSGIELVKKEDFTVDIIKKIIYFQPQALMGGEITSYQKEQVPKFIKHLSECMPELFAKLDSELNGVLSVRINNFNYVGRMALISTINKGEVKDSDNIWNWDGEYLTNSTKERNLIFWDVPLAEVRLKPSKDFYIKIHNNNQVNENTVFKD